MFLCDTHDIITRTMFPRGPRIENGRCQSCKRSTLLGKNFKTICRPTQWSRRRRCNATSAGWTILAAFTRVGSNLNHISSPPATNLLLPRIQASNCIDISSEETRIPFQARLGRQSQYLCDTLAKESCMSCFASMISKLLNGRKTVARVLFRKRELAEFCDKLAELCEKLGELALTHQYKTERKSLSFLPAAR